MRLKLLDDYVEAMESRSMLRSILADKSLAEYELLMFNWNHQQWYLPGEPSITLKTLIFRPQADPQCSAGSVRLIITDQVTQVDEWLAKEQTEQLYATAKEPSRESKAKNLFNRLAEYCSAPLIELNNFINLVPVHIPKPWGQEIWFSGIEARGQSLVGDQKHQIPLPWLLDLGGEVLLGEQYQTLNLLKVLDPLPEPVYGDLYFELHEEKREVYVVSHVDSEAWPDGKGAIRYGFDPQVRAQYASDEDFRSAFHARVTAYEAIRREIDGYYDVCRESEGLALNVPVSPDTLKRWESSLSSELLSREQEAREAMDYFTQLLPLVVGDVVKVPRLLPHSLQHGVRTVEFQTPVYERKILSFGQKVLTQTEWDTDEAVALMETESPAPDELTLLASGDGWRREQIVEFEDFYVERISLSPGGAWQITPGTGYALIMSLTAIELEGRQLGAESAVLVPAGAKSLKVANQGLNTAIILLARPRNPDF